MDPVDFTDKKWISSLDLIEKAGISRATINNYIKMGILPKPILRKPLDQKKRATKIGYFPHDVLEHIKMIKKMKNSGCLLKDIISKLHDENSINNFTKMAFEDKINKMNAENNLIQMELFSLEKEINPINLIDIKSFNLTINHLLQNIIVQLSNRKNIFNILTKQNKPVHVEFCILVSGLQDMERIHDELQPEEYLELMMLIMKCSEESIIKNNGIYGENSGGKIICYFLKEYNNNYIKTAIKCALELKKLMKKISSEWKVRKGWLNELFLNIGLAEGQEYMSIKPTLHSMEFETFGNSLRYARKLSIFALNGSIWSTKSLISKLNEYERGQIHFGIKLKNQENGKWVDNVFSRIIDIIEIDKIQSTNILDISLIPITEILN